MDILIKPLTAELLNDYLLFFDEMKFTENPHWSECYCFSYHFTGSKEQWNKDANRSSVIQYINEYKMTGYLAYSKGKPVGWCNANNRLNYQALLKDDTLIDRADDKICSIVCFLISPGHRRMGIADKLLEQICIDYTKKSYEYLEAYPRKGDLSCEKQYKGPLSLYKKHGFKVVKEYEDSYLVRKRLK